MISFHKPIDQLPGDTDFAGNKGEIVRGKPLGIREFNIINNDLSAFVFSRKTDHQGMGEGPGLASEVADIFYLYTHLLYIKPDPP